MLSFSSSMSLTTSSSFNNRCGNIRLKWRRINKSSPHYVHFFTENWQNVKRAIIRFNFSSILPKCHRCQVKSLKYRTFTKLKHSNFVILLLHMLNRWSAHCISTLPIQGLRIVPPKFNFFVADKMSTNCVSLNVSLSTWLEHMIYIAVFEPLWNTGICIIHISNLHRL